MTTEVISGGCQCGAVRYRVTGELTWPHICHCRMCQKASGNYFMPLANAQKDEFQVTRGQIAWFNSTDVTRRGFCRDCGTPLIFETIKAKHLNITLGSLDRPSVFPPSEQFGLEARMPWFGELDGLAGHATDEGEDDAPQIERIRTTNRQHPDHDTKNWPPRQQD